MPANRCCPVSRQRQAGAPIDELDAERPFKRRNLAADRAMRDAQRFRGARERQVTPHRFEAPKRGQWQMSSVHSGAVFGFEVPARTRGRDDRNFKSTALG